MTHPTDDSLKPCPFCGAGTTEITPNGRMWTGMKYSEPSSVSVRHWCEAVPGQPSRMIERVGRDEASAIDAWNTRALLAEQARTEPTGGFARLAPNALPVGTLYPAIYPAKTAAQPLKAEQAKDAAEDAPSEELPRFNEAQERADFEAHLKAELKSHWIYNNPNGHDLVDMMVSVVPDEINGHKQTNAGRYVDKGIETQWHGWRARAARAAERKA